MKEPSLSEISSLVKSKEFILGIILLIIILVLLVVEFSPHPDKGVAWNDQIFPGITTKNELIQKEGQPSKIENKDGKQILSYKTTSQFRTTQVEIENNKVTLVIESVVGSERGSLKDYTNKFGKQETMLYGKYGPFVPGFFWGTKGILIFASPVNGQISEIWYFSPTNLQNFLQANPTLSLEKPLAP